MFSLRNHVLEYAILAENQKSMIKFPPIYTNILNRNKENEHSEKQNYFKRHLTGFKEKETLKYNKVQLHWSLFNPMLDSEAKYKFGVTVNVLG